MNGIAGISQYPIASGESFTYEIQINGQSGTYLYRSELNVQGADDLVGPLVILSKGEREL